MLYNVVQQFLILKRVSMESNLSVFGFVGVDTCSIAIKESPITSSGFQGPEGVLTGLDRVDQRMSTIGSEIKRAGDSPNTELKSIT